MKKEPRIVAISLNTAIDKIIKVADFQVGVVTRAISNEEYASGKALNTIKSIKSFDVKSKLIGFCGYDFLDTLKLSTEIELKNVSFEVINNKTRQNITLIDSKSNKLISHIQTDGYSVCNKDVESLFSMLFEIEDNDIVIVSGSLPNGFDLNSYKDFLKLIKKKSKLLILDTSGKALKTGIKCEPDIIKPNLDELSSLFDLDKSELTNEKIKQLSRNLIKKEKIKEIFIGLGSDGAIYSSNKNYELYYAKINELHKDTLGDEIGCGDCFVGGLAFSKAKNLKEKETLVNAMSFATANLYSKGPGNIDKIKYYEFINKVNITKF